MQSPEYTFLFADLAGYTALTEAHGDEGGATVATRFHALTRAALEAAELVKTLGDGVMVVASDVPSAVRVAERLCAMVAEQRDFPAMRIGIHRGGAAVRDGDYFGNSVNLAARVMEASSPGRVMCTECVAAEVSAAGLALVAPHGVVSMKHVTQPMALYELTFEGVADSRRLVDPVCRMLVLTDGGALTHEHEGREFFFCSPGCRDRFANEPETFLGMVTSWHPPAPRPRR